MAQVTPGALVRDKITGIEGIVTARSEFLYGCTRLMVQPKSSTDGKPAEGLWLDEPQVIEIEGDNLKSEYAAFRTTEVTTEQGRHGPRDDAQRAPDARR